MSERKRARSIRRIDPGELDFAQGGLVDDSIPNDEIEAIWDRFSVQADREVFQAFLRERIAFFRSLGRSSETEPTTAQEIKLVDELRDLAQELRTRLDRLPPDAAARLDRLTWQMRGELFHDCSERLEGELSFASSVLALTARELEQYRGKGRGAKRKSNRDWFLSDVSQWLTDNDSTMDAARSYEVTHALCLALPDVGVPEHTDDAPGELGEIIRDWRKRQPERPEN